MPSSGNDSERAKTVNIGSKVKINLNDETEKVFTIGSTKEADPSRGVISSECPLGKALMGAKAGEDVSYIVGDITFTVHVLETN